jgi:glycosyltransferase involved in cell wall biosynthesis
MPRVAFGLTRPYTPRYEAVSREIEALRDVSRDPVVAVLPMRSNPFVLRRDAGVLTGHPVSLRLTGYLRASLAGADVLHVWAPLPLPRRLRALWTRARAPRLLTVIATGGTGAAVVASLAAFDHVVVECSSDARWLREAGFAKSPLTLVHPCAPASSRPPFPAGPFTVLFASWPFEPDEAHGRGLDLLAEAARLRPDMRFLVLTRPTSAVDPTHFGFPANVAIDARVHGDFELVWSRVHAVLAPFRAGSKSKSVPNSVVEGLTAGRPAVVTSTTGLASLVTEHGAGAVCDAEGRSLAQALDAVASDLDGFSRRSIELAESRFGVERFRRSYADIYSSLVAEAGRRR